MSFHFTVGTYGAYADVGPGDIVVDATAEVHSTVAAAALGLSLGPWTVTIKGKLTADIGDALYLATAGQMISTVTIADGAVLTANSLFRSGVLASHATNVTNAGKIVAQFAGIFETGDGDF